MIPELKPFDIITVDGLWYYPHHHLIEWRQLDSASHVAIIAESTGICYSAELGGVKILNIFDEYKGREVQIHRYCNDIPANKFYTWLGANSKAKYDFWGQWFLGFALGIGVQKIADDSNRFTCSELAYWLFQDNDCKLTSTNEVLPMPRLFRYHNDFELIYNGKL